MKYFIFDETSVAKYAFGIPNDEIMEEVGNINAAVTNLSTSQIKQRIKNVYSNKEQFKNLITNFESFEEVEKIALLEQFYKKNYNGIKSPLIEWYKNEGGYSETAQIKTTLIADYMFEGGFTRQYFTKLRLLVKDGVKLSTLKRYTSDEIDDLIKLQKIVVLGYSMDKRANVSGRIDLARYYEEKFFPDFEKIGVASLCERYPQVAKMLLEDVTAKELKLDYEVNYLPAYKTALKYLAGCAKASKEYQAQKKKKLLSDIAECDKQSKSFVDIEKDLENLSKGR